MRSSAPFQDAGDAGPDFKKKTSVLTSGSGSGCGHSINSVHVGIRAGTRAGILTSRGGRPALPFDDERRKEYTVHESLIRGVDGKCRWFIGRKKVTNNSRVSTNNLVLRVIA